MVANDLNKTNCHSVCENMSGISLKSKYDYQILSIESVGNQPLFPSASLISSQLPNLSVILTFKPS
jgi:hypothetical protein